MQTAATAEKVVADPGNDLSADLLEGADSIATFMFGSPNKRKKVYHLVENGRLPVFRLGSTLCARKTVLMDWIAAQESRAVKGQ